MTDSGPLPLRVSQPGELGPDSGSVEKALNRSRASRWIGWRLRILVFLTLLGCLLVFALMQWLSTLPYFGGAWQETQSGQLELTSSANPGLAADLGKRVESISAGGVTLDLGEARLVQHSARWLIDETQRARQRELQRDIAHFGSLPGCTLNLVGGEQLACTRERGIGHVPAMFWVFIAIAMLLYLVGLVVVLVRPSTLNLLYATITLSQAGNLTFAALEAALDLGTPPDLLLYDFLARGTFDLVSAAALVHVVSLYPLALPHGRVIAACAWAGSLVVAAATAAGALPHAWMWIQGTAALLGGVAIGALTWSYRLEPRPLSLEFRRFAVAITAVWCLLTVALVFSSGRPWLQANIASTGTLFWYFGLAGVLLVAPLLSRSQQIMREFGLLAAISAFATLLDLVFVGLFSVSQFSSGAISLFFALAAYLAARQWLLNRLLGTSMSTTERMFDQLYRIAREVEAHPERAPSLLAELLRELFAPLEVELIPGPVSRTRTSVDGSTMIVPVPALGADEQSHEGAIVLRFAQRGNRLFTSEDVRLTDRIVEQLERAVAYDQAVERGRGEERLRLAQDLHDDIGARLLTLIYKAQSPEMEEYARRTLQDLKTLTRGLAAANHRLSHASSEWKADLAHRLNAASIEFDWSCEFDADLVLSVVQWSAITRILRELVSNVIAHSSASRVEVSIRVEADAMHLSVVDNGSGREPKLWSHGLGLGGVRKRAKQLGGHVEWVQLAPRGICCRVTVLELSRTR
jgi:signal transduction histidine kinase